MKKRATILNIIFVSLKGLSGKNLMRLFRLSLRHPLFAGLTLWATLKTYALAEKHYPLTHAGHGEGNAFRHALWNCLILMYCCKVSSPEKALSWTATTTNLHEDLFPNTPIQRKMDLHNNQVGRDYFMGLLPTIHRQFFETSFFVAYLLELAKNCKTLENPEQTFGFELIKIE